MTESMNTASVGKLMTWLEYASIAHEIPYKFTLESEHSFLFYFGERHCFDPESEQWKEEDIFWQEFLEKTKGKKRVVFVEGGLRKPEQDKKQAILKEGGMGYITHLAYLAGIEVYSPEPDDKFERQELEKKFSKEVIQYYYFARMADQWHKKEEPKQSFVDYISNFLESDKKDSRWTDFDFSLANMLVIHKNLFETMFDQNNSDFFYEVSNPINNLSQVNEVSRASSEIRDLHIISQIEKYKKDDYSIFLQYGCSHAVLQEPVIRHLFK